jgi:hypothetical protein
LEAAKLPGLDAAKKLFQAGSYRKAYEAAARLESGN